MSESDVPNEPWDRIAKLILAARGGSSDALGELMKSSRQYLLFIANSEFPPELQPKGGASDLVQQTQMEAFQAFAGFRGETGDELLGWLRQILLNNLRDFNRQYQGVEKRQVDREVPLESAADGRIAQQLVADQSSPSGRLQNAEQLQKLENAVAQLPDDYRQVVVWHHRDGYSFEEISERLDRSVGAVRKLWSRAIRHLKSRKRKSEG